jgi:DNA-binding winged helix-turn-helix (wHTH) protein
MVTPEGEIKNIYFADFLQQSQQNEITIGRLSSNHITLPDPYKNISRQHCTIELKQNTWTIQDSGSANGTFIQRSGLEQEIDVRRHDFVPLKDQDKILILSHITPEECPIFWQLTFFDPGVTKPNEGFEAPYVLEYNLNYRQLKKINRYEQEIINLTKHQSLLIHYMAQRNYENQSQPVLCSYKELIEAIWGDDFGHSRNEITHLIWGIRSKIELDSGEPEFMQSVRGQGYRLHLKVVG